MKNSRKINGKIIFITGGVLSSLGKGIFAASLAFMFKERGLKVNMMKFDPYLNVDPGTISPIEHGEVFVTKDGGETDLDIGHYERFINQNLSKNSSISSGKIYRNLIEKERRGKYLGKTVQIIPHVINEIIDLILNNLKNNDLLIVEIGGTVGDIESIPYFEAIRQLQFERENVINIHIGFVPFLSINKEYKSKPFQHSIKELHSLGVFPNFLIVRTENKINNQEVFNKISINCGVNKEYILELENLPNVYQIPKKLMEEKIDQKIAKILNLKLINKNIEKYDLFNNLISYQNKDKLRIAIVGKYHNLKDSYLSIIESLKIISIYKKIDLKIDLLDSKSLDLKKLNNYSGIIISGGFGTDGTDGKIKTIKYARENNIPLLGICFGMQLLILEFANNVLNLNLYHQELNPEKKQKFIIHLLEDQDLKNFGGTMRLGEYECKIFPNTIASKIYKKDLINQRHRHRYEFNNQYKNILEKNGLVFSGINPQTNLVEIVEYPKNDFFIAVQFHPEFNTKIFKLDPLFESFIEASNNYGKKWKNNQER
ncbi:CTP synthase [Candidatus Hepatoplasma crinochetorum]|uniref:CTP synthase n=1 Tax=Candidatus Hepatoplasma crinochetorum Av TaxID=1427984 RepID=W8GNR7_9MOLU|nr:CTP synthase [Candidatus Hepatoplasma crinochetorum]AHK22681.1 CTP synthase [Candidatus Hepatoplasma crinochetorum Av]BDV03255.1 MAG: CTP synthase [Candidatus Hepatoplasma crinochetorum]